LQEGELRHILETPVKTSKPYCTLNVSSRSHSLPYDLTIGTLTLTDISSSLVQGIIYTTFEFRQDGDQPIVRMKCLPARRDQGREITPEEFQSAVEGKDAFEMTEILFQY